MKTTKTPDHNPTGRTRPKRKMGTVLRAKLSKYRARVSEFEDDAPSSTVVRWLVVLLLLHLLVIGGVYVRSTWFRNTAETVEMAAAPYIDTCTNLIYYVNGLCCFTLVI